MKRWEKRRYFVTQWEPGPPVDHLGPLQVDLFLSLLACTIYGYEEDSEFDQDHQSIDSGMKQGLIFGRWFSTQCVEGEWGNHRISELKDISRQEFDAFEKRGWTNMD